MLGFLFKNKNEKKQQIMHSHNWEYRDSCYQNYSPKGDEYGIKIYDVFTCDSCMGCNFELRETLIETYHSDHVFNLRVVREDCISYSEAMRKYR